PPPPPLFPYTTLFRSLACPACGGGLSAVLACTGCGKAWPAPDGIPQLRLPVEGQTEKVRQFYNEAPFPNYPPNDSLTWLRTRARSEEHRLNSSHDQIS